MHTAAAIYAITPLLLSYIDAAADDYADYADDIITITPLP